MSINRRCCVQCDSGGAGSLDTYEDLDDAELREVARTEFGFNLAAAADHLRRLRDYHEHYTRQLSG